MIYIQFDMDKMSWSFVFMKKMTIILRGFRTDDTVWMFTKWLKMRVPYLSGRSIVLIFWNFGQCSSVDSDVILQVITHDRKFIQRMNYDIAWLLFFLIFHHQITKENTTAEIKYHCIDVHTTRGYMRLDQV